MVLLYIVTRCATNMETKMRGTALPHTKFSISDIEFALESAEAVLGCAEIQAEALQLVLKNLTPLFNLLHVLASPELQERSFNVQMMLLDAAYEKLVPAVPSKQPGISQPDPLLADLQQDLDSPAVTAKAPVSLEPASPTVRQVLVTPPPLVHPDLLPLKVRTTELCVCDACQSDDLQVTLPWCHSQDEQISVEYECLKCHHKGLDLVLRTEALRVRQAQPRPQPVQAAPVKQTAVQQPAVTSKAPVSNEQASIEVTIPAAPRLRGRPKKTPAAQTQSPVGPQRAGLTQQPVNSKLAVQQNPAQSKQSTNDFLDKLLANTPVAAHPDKILQELLPQVLAWPPAKILREYEQMLSLKAPVNPSQDQFTLMARAIAGRIVGVPAT